MSIIPKIIAIANNYSKHFVANIIAKNDVQRHQSTYVNFNL